MIPLISQLGEKEKMVKDFFAFYSFLSYHLYNDPKC